jgi:phage replication-related protein YjqB (UPF0714/DUF867 family)
MGDKYENFAELDAAETEGRDYEIKLEKRDSPIVIIAPHGGGIEPGTSEIAESVAGDDFSFYAFEGVKDTDNEDLHITSIRFDEPKGLDLVRQSEIVVAIHGLRRRKTLIDVGGRDQTLRKKLISALTQAGFEARTDNSHHAGSWRSNICNQGINREGVQLEISRGLRLTMFEGLNSKGRQQTKQPFHNLVEALRRVLLRI